MRIEIGRLEAPTEPTEFDGDSIDLQRFERGLMKDVARGAVLGTSLLLLLGDVDSVRAAGLAQEAVEEASKNYNTLFGFVVMTIAGVQEFFESGDVKEVFGKMFAGYVLGWSGADLAHLVSNEELKTLTEFFTNVERGWRDVAGIVLAGTLIKQWTGNVGGWASRKKNESDARWREVYTTKLQRLKDEGPGTFGYRGNDIDFIVGMTGVSAEEARCGRWSVPRREES